MKAARSFNLFFEALFGRVATVRELDAYCFGEVLIREGLHISQGSERAHEVLIQELLGHKGVKTTMIYTHVLNHGGPGIRRSAGFQH
jgi:hypothetical protein